MAKQIASSTSMGRTVQARTLQPRMDVDSAMAIIMTDAQMRWLNRVGAASAGQVEGVHQLRVGLRRLRSALSLLRDYIPPRQRAALDAELKWLVNALAPVRDLDVFMHELLHPAAATAGPAKVKNTQALAVLTAAAAQARAEAQRRARKALVSLRHRKLVQRVSDWISAREWRTGRIAKRRFTKPIGKVARQILNARLRKIHKQGRHIRKLSPEGLHALRISIKKVRYGVGFFKTALPRKTRKLAQALAELQETLGHLNDAAMTEQIMARLVRRTAGADARQELVKAGARIIALHKKTAADVGVDIAPRWKALKSLGTI